MVADGSLMAKRRPLPTCPATATITSGSPIARMRRTGERFGWRSAIGWLVTSCWTCATTGCGPPLCPATMSTTGSAMARAALLRSENRGRDGGGTR